MLKFLKLCFAIVFIFSVSDALAQKWESITGDDPEPERSSQSERSSPQKKLNVTGGDTATMLANAAKKYEKAVGLMVFTHSETGPLPHCTAWAIKSNVFLTNAHCFKRVAKYRKIPGVTWYVILNRDPSKKFRMLEWKIHPRYGERSANFDGKVNKISPFDVGLFKIDGKVDVTFPIAPREELKKISSGYPVATLGFPQEGLVGKNVSVRDPVASMQTGIIVAMTDYWDGDSGFAKNTMLKHNMGTAGGASGSPMFNRKGEVIGLVNAGNIEKIFAIDKKTGSLLVNNKGEPETKRIDSAAMINFGVRIDTINALFR